ncbi:MAG TPA: hypothetical protein VFB67_04940 [Candidatus Polarisedimenticolaceae bacterium]|nr:hypothetical protein [Candidatus Polarisedimenticolaceae bacterium]
MQLPLALVLDAEAPVRVRVRDALKDAGLDVADVATPQQAFDALRTRSVAVVLAGIASPKDVSLELVERITRLRPTAVVGILEGNGDPEGRSPASVDAFDVLPRHPRPKCVTEFGRRALAQHRMLDELRRLRDEVGTAREPRIAGRSAPAERLRREIADLTASRGPVLFSGEPGSGRSYAARCLLAAMGAGEPPRTLKGMEGLPRALPEGDVFLDSIEKLPWGDQERLAQHLASGRGSGRILMSAGPDPERAAGEARLHPGIAGAPGLTTVRIAPLHERPEDVPPLVRAFIESLRRLNGLPPIGVEPEALAALSAYRWPGNVRELRDAVETAMVLAPDGIVRQSDLPAFVRGGVGPAEPGVRADRPFRTAKRKVVDAFERSYLADLLRRHEGNVTGAAEHAGMLRSALQRLLRKHDLRSVDFRA